MAARFELAARPCTPRQPGLGHPPMRCVAGPSLARACDFRAPMAAACGVVGPPLKLPARSPACHAPAHRDAATSICLPAATRSIPSPQASPSRSVVLRIALWIQLVTGILSPGPSASQHAFPLQFWQEQLTVCRAQPRLGDKPQGGCAARFCVTYAPLLACRNCPRTGSALRAARTRSCSSPSSGRWRALLRTR